MEELKKKINDLKKQANTSNIVGAVILVASIAGWLIGTLKKIKALSGFSIIFIIVSVVFFIIRISKFLTYKKANKNINNNSSYANKTYGGLEEYSHFVAYLNKKAQTAKNAAVNTLSALTSVFGFGGVFVSGQNGWDVFVNKNNIILNCPNKNESFSDNKFKIVETSKIKKVDFETLKGIERVKISMRDTEKIFVIDVIIKSIEEIEIVRETFKSIVVN